MTLVLSRLLSHLASALARRLPDLVLGVLRDLARWYFRLGMVAMFLVAVIAGGFLMSALPSILGTAGFTDEIRGLLGRLLVLWLLVVILWGLVRAR